MMKNKFLFLMILGLAFFASCSDDDKDPFKNYSVDFSGDKLDLTFNGKKLEGKSVCFKSMNQENASLTLKNMIAGEDSLVINNLTVAEQAKNDFSFVGENKNGDRTVSVEGAVRSGVLDLKTTFKITSKVVGEWKLIPYDSSTGSGALYVNIVPEADTSTIIGLPVSYFTALASSVGAQLLPNLLEKVTFREDGNLIARYLEDMSEIGVENAKKTDSPEGLVTFNIKDEQLYLAVDVESLMKVRSTGMSLDAIIGMVSNGLPLKLDLQEGSMRVYVDQQMMLPFMNLLEALIPMIQASEDLKDYVSIVYDVIRLVRTAEKVELGLNLVSYTETPTPAVNVQSLSKMIENAKVKFVK